MAIGYKEQSGASVPTPGAGEQYTFIDSADNKLKRKDSTGAVTPVEVAAGNVSTVFGRSGDVLAVSGDYSGAQVSNTPAGNIIATNVQDAINELDAEKAPLTHVGSTGISQHGVATDSVAGFMSPSDKSKLDGVQAGATANQADSFLLSRANHTGTQSSSTISDFVTSVDGRITLQKGAANGLATLDGSSRVPIAQLPPSIVGALSFQTTWNASLNSPPLSSGVGTKGHYYVVSVDGSTNLDGITDWKAGDWVIFDGVAWKKLDQTESVTSVNGYQGAVVLNKADVGLGNVDNVSDLNKPISNATQAALDLKANLSSAISQLTGEVLAGPGGGAQAATVTNAAVIGKVLTGLSETYGVPSATDTIIQALSKLVWSQGIHAKDINQDMSIPNDYVLIRGRTNLLGTSVLTIGNGAVLQLI